jgi:hypothetical protein
MLSWLRRGLRWLEGRDDGRVPPAARRLALERHFGRATPDRAAASMELFVFDEHIIGATLYVSAGRRYDFAICFRRDDDPGVTDVDRVLSAFRRRRVHPEEAAFMRDRFLPPSAVAGFLFTAYGEVATGSESRTILLAIGITEDELEDCETMGSTAVLERLHGAGVFPFTDIDRESAGSELA